MFAHFRKFKLKIRNSRFKLVVEAYASLNAVNFAPLVTAFSCFCFSC